MATIQERVSRLEGAQEHVASKADLAEATGELKVEVAEATGELKGRTQSRCSRIKR